MLENGVLLRNNLLLKGQNDFKETPYIYNLYFYIFFRFKLSSKENQLFFVKKANPSKCFLIP